MSTQTTTIRVKAGTRDRFADLSATTGRSMTDLLDEAATALEREIFFTRFEQRYAELREDQVAWAEILSERSLEESTLRDSSR